VGEHEAAGLEVNAAGPVRQQWKICRTQVPIRMGTRHMIWRATFAHRTGVLAPDNHTNDDHTDCNEYAKRQPMT